MKVVVKYGTDSDARIDLLADSSILSGGRPLFVPDWAQAFVGTLAVTARVGRLGKCIVPRFAHRYWDGASACLLTHGVDADGNRIDRGALSRAHDGALMLGEMRPKEALMAGATVTCVAGGTTVNAALDHMAQAIDALVCQVSQHMTLKMGDMLCIALPDTVSLGLDMAVELSCCGTTVLKTKIK